MNKQILQRIITTLPICFLGLFTLPILDEDVCNTTMSNIVETVDAESIVAITTAIDTETNTVTESITETVTEADTETLTEADAEADTEVVTETTAGVDTEEVTETDTTSEQLTIVSITDISYTMGYAIPAGTDWEEFFAAYFSDEVWQLSVPCATADGDTIYAGVTWSDPKPNTSATGSINLTGTLVLPDNTTLADSARTFRVHCYVSIQAEGTPTLDSWYIIDDAIHLPWVSSGVENMNAVVLYQQDESGYWSECDSFYCDSEAVHLDVSSLTYGAVYSIWVVWDEGSTNIFSFTYTGTVSTANNIGGDRDGGDSSGNSLSGVRQEAPEASEEADSSDTSDSADASDSADTSDSADASDSSNASGSFDASGSAGSSSSSGTSGSSNASGSSDVSDSSDASGSADMSNSSDASNSKNTSDSQSASDSQVSSGLKSTSGLQTDNSACSTTDSYNESDTGTSESNSDSGSDSANSDSSKSGSSKSNSSYSEPFMETVTDTYSLISGTRLNLMRQTGSVRFSKQGITVTLSDAALDALNITNDSRFYIEIRKTETGFSLIVELDGQTVTNLPDTTVMLPYVFSDTDKINTNNTNANNTDTDGTDADHTDACNGDANYTLLLRDESGHAITGSYNTESRIVTFTIQHTGIYTLITTSSAFETGDDIDTVLIPDSDANDEVDVTDGSTTDGKPDAIDTSDTDDESDAVNASDAGDESDAVDASDADDESDTEFPLESLVSSHDDSDHHSLALSVHVTGIVFAVLFLLAAALFFLSCSKVSTRRQSHVDGHLDRRFTYFFKNDLEKRIPIHSSRKRFP